MLETAMLKVFSTDVLWRIVNDTLQIFGGKGYFNDEPYERMMRDARINMIGEGANDVLRAFIALVGMRDVGLELKGVLDALKSPLGNLSFLGSFASRRLASMVHAPEVRVRSMELADEAQSLGKLVGSLGSNVERLLRRYRESVLDRQYLLGRVADAATEIYVASCVLNRLDALLRDSHISARELERSLVIGRYYLTTSARRVRRNLADLWDHDDEETTKAANLLLSGGA